LSPLYPTLHHLSTPTEARRDRPPPRSGRSALNRFDRVAEPDTARRGNRCMDAERHFQLPLTQYVHDGAGIVEFVGITLALLLAVRRTRSQRTVTARTYRALAIGAAIMYPILGLTYVINKLGAIVEGVFFVGFTVMVVVQLHERLAQRRLSADHNEAMIGRWVKMPEPASPPS